MIIGEAAKRLSPDFKTKHIGVDWRGVAGMRDKLIHHYRRVDLDEVWLVATEEVPALVALLEPYTQLEQEDA